MSEDNNGGAVDQKEVPEEKVVPLKSYEQVQKDMHKFKAQAREQAAKVAQYEANQKALEEQRLVEQEQYKEAYEKSKAEAEAYRQQAEAEKQNSLLMVKKTALKQELGGNVKDVYLSHANIADIQINPETGTVDTDSLLEVANAFRTDHGILLGKTSGGNPTGMSANEIDTNKSLDQLTKEEKFALLKSKK